jgi:electron transport complex protein RnfC
MKKKLGGVKAPHFKNTSAVEPEFLPVPKEVTLSMSMHSGAPAEPVVSAGDYVKVGQLVGEASGLVSSPVHASVSGKVKSIEAIEDAAGKSALAVIIESDGAQTPCETAPPIVTNRDEFLQAVKNSGVIGLGGAGYPTAHKLTLKDYGKLDYILVNGAECEPYITSDTRTMVDDCEYVWEGVKLMLQYLEPKNIVICIEDNKPEPIKKMKDLCAGTPCVKVQALPSLYPQGERKVLVYNVTGRIVPEGGRLPDVGCIVINCTTIAVFAKYIKTGMPLVSRCITVDGSAVKNPKNVITPVGTPVRCLFDYCGVSMEDVKKIIVGGPMMGAAIPNANIPVSKTTNAVLAFSAKDAEPPPVTACIKCARCINKCPMGLMPPLIENAFELKKPGLLEKFKVNMCADCGCCAYTCPAKRPLVQVMRMSNEMLSKYKNERKGA